MKLVYIAGRFRGATPWDVEKNIRAAEEVGFEVATLGAMPVIPHSMTRYFDKTLTDAFWLAGTMELLSQCDAVMTVANHAESKGAAAELAAARADGKPVFHDFPSLATWIKADDEPAAGDT